MKTDLLDKLIKKDSSLDLLEKRLEKITPQLQEFVKRKHGELAFLASKKANEGMTTSHQVQNSLSILEFKPIFDFILKSETDLTEILKMKDALYQKFCVKGMVVSKNDPVTRRMINHDSNTKTIIELMQRLIDAKEGILIQLEEIIEVDKKARLIFDPMLNQFN